MYFDLHQVWYLLIMVAYIVLMIFIFGEYMHHKKVLQSIFCGLILLQFPVLKTHAITTHDLYWGSGVSCCAILSALLGYSYTNSLKHTYQTSIKEVESKLDLCNQELNTYKDDTVQFVQGQQKLAQVSDCLQRNADFYEDELALMSGTGDYSSAIFIKNFIDRIQARLKRDGISVLVLENSFQNALEQTVAAKHTLELLDVEWGEKEGRQLYREHMQKLAQCLYQQIEQFKSIIGIFNVQKNYITLVYDVLARNFEQTYAFEVKLGQNNFDGLSHARELDKHIRVMFSDEKNQFPYLEYTHQINSDRSVLKQALQKLDEFDAMPFQQDIISRAQSLYQLIGDIFEFIVTTQTYQEEKKYKPEFDIQQERLQAELKERKERLEIEMREKQARIENEKTLVQSRLLQEQNNAQEVANARAAIERDRQNVVLKEREIVLELARIQDGKNIKVALQENDMHWQRQVENLDQQRIALEQERMNLLNTVATLEQANTSFNGQSGHLQQRINQLEEQKQLVTKELEDLKQQRALDLKKHAERIKHIEEHLEGLENALPVLPCNPESVEGLSEYINKLLGYIMDIREAVSG